MVALVDEVHPPQQVVDPERAALGDAEAQARGSARTRRTRSGTTAAATTRTAPRSCRCRCAGRRTPCRRRPSARAPASRAPRTSAHTGSYRGWWYGSCGCHIGGMRMPPRRPESWARRISATAASTSAMIGTIATPARRSGLSRHSSASHRLWARAPARSSSGGVSPVAPSPAPNGADAPEVTESASGKMTSPATPSASSSLSRRPASQPPRRPSSFSACHSSANSSLRNPCSGQLASSAPVRRAHASKRSRYSGSSHSRYSAFGQPGVAVGRDHQVAGGHRQLLEVGGRRSGRASTRHGRGSCRRCARSPAGSRTGRRGSPATASSATASTGV